MTDRELKPCPFCGGDAERVDIAEGENAGGSCISCTACQASGNVEFGYKENFVSNWNRRASHNRERGEVKQLEWKFLSTPPSGEEYASTSLGTYFIELGYKRFPVKLHSYQLGTYDTLEEAKAAAQADYESRIRSCLLDKPEAGKGEGEALKAEVKALVPTERLDQLIGSVDPTSAEIHDMAVELILWRQSKPAEPKAWFVKDFADGWIHFDNEADARREVDATGALMLVAYPSRIRSCLLAGPANNSGSNGETLEKSCRNDAKNDPENQNIDRLRRELEETRRKAFEEAAAMAEEFHFMKDIEWWLNSTKKKISAETCLLLAAAIRQRAKEQQP